MPNLITLGSLIDHTVEHYRLHFKELIGISLWLVVAAMPFLFAGYLAPFGVDEYTPTNEVVTYLLVSFIGLVTVTLARLWTSVCLIFTIDARAKGSTPDHVALGKKSWKYLLSFFVLSICIALGLSLAAGLFLLPGLAITMLNHLPGAAGTALGIFGVIVLFAGILAAGYTLVKYSVELAFSQYFLLLESENTRFSLKALRNALAASRKSVKGRWWAVALRLVVPSLIIGLIAYGITATTNLAATVLISFAAASLSPLAITLISVALTLSVFIVLAIIMPLYSLTTYYLYDSTRK